MNKRLFLILLAFFVVGCVALSHPISPSAPEVKTVDELQRPYAELQGEWVVYEANVGRVDLMPMVGKRVYYEGNRFWFEGDPGYEVFVIDSQSTPKKIDYWSGDAVVKGIYRINGERLDVCTAPPGSRRPTKFRPPLFSRYILSRAERQSPKRENVGNSTDAGQ